MLVGGAGEKLAASTVVIAGVESREAAERIAVEARPLIEKDEAGTPAALTIKQIEDTWLVEVTGLSGDGTSPDPLLSTLAKRYPGMLLLPSGAAPSVGGRVVEEHVPPASQWSVAAVVKEYVWSGGGAILLLGAILWLFLHLRRLRGLREKQHRLEYRQNALRVKMERNGRGH